MTSTRSLGSGFGLEEVTMIRLFWALCYPRVIDASGPRNWIVDGAARRETARFTVLLGRRACGRDLHSRRPNGAPFRRRVFRRRAGGDIPACTADKRYFGLSRDWPRTGA